MLDISGSMYGENGEKIYSLNHTANNLLDGLKKIVPEPNLASITFGSATTLIDFAPVSQVKPFALAAQGKTPLTEAIALAKTVVTENVITILISDGAPNDGQFSKISLKGSAYAIGVGLDANYEELARFTGNSDRVFPPYAAEDAASYILSSY